MQMRGKFIVFEGVDRSGKTTQSKLLYEHLKSQGENVQLIRFPDRTTAIGLVLNNYLNQGADPIDPHTAHLLFSANRWEWQNKLEKLLADGVTILCDRYAHSGVAYSAGALGFDIEWTMSPDKGLIAPDKIFYLDVPTTEDALLRGSDDELYDRASIQKKVKEVYNLIGEEKTPADVWTPIPAVRTISEVEQDIRERTMQLLKEGDQTPIRYLWFEG